MADWMRSRLRVASSNLASRLDHVVEEKGRAAIQRLLELTKRIEGLMPRFLSANFHDSGRGPFNTMLFHDALSLDNILISGDGVLSGVLDWQCILAVPCYEACQFPAFLQQAYDRFRQPASRWYLIDDKTVHGFYFQDLDQYALTELRRLYIEHMLDCAPGFVNIWRNNTSADMRDYEAAIQHCDNEFTVDFVEEWVEAMEQGKDPIQMLKRLHERLMGPYSRDMKTYTFHGLQCIYEFAK